MTDPIVLVVLIAYAALAGGAVARALYLRTPRAWAEAGAVVVLPVAVGWAVWRLARSGGADDETDEPPKTLPRIDLPEDLTTEEDHVPTPDHPGDDADLSERVDWLNDRAERLDD